jgi:hypothetical protein
MDISLMVIYQMWLARNDTRENRVIENPESIMRRSIHLVEEWHGIRIPSPVRVAPPKKCCSCIRGLGQGELGWSNDQDRRERWWRCDHP